MDAEKFQLLMSQVKILELTGEDKMLYIAQFQEREEKIRQKQIEIQAKKEKEERDLVVKREREKEERDAQREREKEEREAQRLKEERELEMAVQKEREEREFQALREDKVREQEIRLKELEFKLEAERISIEREKLNVSQSQPDNDNDDSQFVHKGVRYPKIPYFNESKDDIDSYLFRFEAFAKNSRWKECDWPMLLGVHLQGTALSLYHGLCAAGDVDYQTLKTALLTKYMCTKDGFREKFRTSRPEPDESFLAFGARFGHLFDRWIELAQIDKTFDGLRDLLFCEHILACVSKDLSVFLRERDLHTSIDMLSAAECYRLAHPQKSMARATKIELGLLSSAEVSPGHQFREGYSSPGATAPPFPRGRGRQPSSAQAFSGPRFQDFRSRNRIRGSRGRGRFPQTPSDNPSRPRCYKCMGFGHVWQECPSYVKKQAPKQHANVSFALEDSVQEVLCSSVSSERHSLPICDGTVNGFVVSVLRDSGATTAGVRRSLVRPEQFIGKSQSVVSFGGKTESFPLALVDVHTPFFSGQLRCCVIDEPVADLILGNVPGVSPIPGLIMNDSPPTAAAVETRSQKKKSSQGSVPLSVPYKDLNLSKDQLISEQKHDASLSRFFGLAENGSSCVFKKSSCSFQLEDGVLFRCFAKADVKLKQVVVPSSQRVKVLFAAHDGLLSGHCGIRKTLARVHTRFWWPGVAKQVKDYCRTCVSCQKFAPKGRTPDVPLSKMPTIEVPFDRVAIDIVGPFSPQSEDKHRYLLTIVDVATRFPEAVPLKTIDSATIAEALFTVFCRLGFPKEILSDNGSQFTSEMFQQFLSFLSIKGVRSSPYHAQSNGVVERFHGTLKPMLRKMVEKRPQQWHRHVPALLFACRELPNDSTGFSPFELLFGRRARGPIDFLADAWLEKDNLEEASHVCAYVSDLKSRISEMCHLAQKSAQVSAETQKRYRDKKTRSRSFQVGDEVLVFLPTTKNKLLMMWKGPFKVVRALDFDYLVDVGGKSKIFHPNMLKQFHRRDQQSFVSVVGSTCSFSDILSPDFVSDYRQSPVRRFEVVSSNVVRDPSSTFFSSVAVIESGEDFDDDCTHNVHLPTMSVPSVETFRDVHYSSELTPSQCSEIRGVFEKFSPILTTMPGHCSLDIEHEIHLTTDTPVFRKQYPLPFSSQQIIKQEVQTMLDLGVIEPSHSPFSAPVVLVKKPDGSTRFCCDYRELNKVTLMDAEPIPDPDQLFSLLAHANYFTKIDLTKGYWQIPVKKADRPKTAFQTPLGLFQWTRMPFGLSTAPATFARAMRAIHLPDSAINFFDDVLIFSKLWSTHVSDVDHVLSLLDRAGLTARPSKIFAGFTQLDFLGHTVGRGVLKPEEKKIGKILDISPPHTKKQVRALLGLVGYYRKFVPNFAAITAPISDLLSGHSRKKFDWSPSCQSSLDVLKDRLNSHPILLLPDLSKPFVVRTDASSVGIGGVLLQEREGVLHPVTFVSRKLLDRETRYSTIERECLAIVWAITKLGRYLWGQVFTLQTDHRPLTYLRSSVFRNARIMRWSLLLQQFQFSIAPLPGCANQMADYLSRQ